MITVEAIAADPSLAAGLPRDQLVRLYQLAVAAQGALLPQLFSSAEPKDEIPDQLLTATEAGARLGYTRDWMYRHADTLPFTVRIPGARPRFSAHGLARYLRRNQSRP